MLQDVQIRFQDPEFCWWGRFLTMWCPYVSRIARNGLHGVLSAALFYLRYVSSWPTERN